MSDVLVLCYHAVSRDWTAPLSVTPGALAEQLEGLLRRGYHGATFTAAATAPPASRTLVVTFDDAFRSVLELAEPILSRLGLPGTVFVPTDFPDSGRPLAWPGVEHWLGGRHEAELVPLSWQELRRLAESGWEVGSHTRSHPMLTRLDEKDLIAELGGSRSACEGGTGRPCLSVAYPYGDVNARVVSAARAAGYLAGAGLPGRLHPVRPLEWPRIGIYHVDDRWRFAQKVSPTGRRLRSSALVGAALDRLRKPRA